MIIYHDDVTHMYMYMCTYVCVSSEVLTLFQSSGWYSLNISCGTSSLNICLRNGGARSKDYKITNIYVNLLFFVLMKLQFV